MPWAWPEPNFCHCNDGTCILSRFLILWMEKKGVILPQVARPSEPEWAANKKKSSRGIASYPCGCGKKLCVLAIPCPRRRGTYSPEPVSTHGPGQGSTTRSHQPCNYYVQEIKDSPSLLLLLKGGKEKYSASCQNPYRFRIMWTFCVLVIMTGIMN